MNTRVGAVSPDDIHRYIRQRQAAEWTRHQPGAGGRRAVFNSWIEGEVGWQEPGLVSSQVGEEEPRVRYLLGEEERRLMEAPTSATELVGLAINVGFRRATSSS